MKTFSSRRIYSPYLRLEDVLAIHLQDPFQTFSRRFQDVFKISGGIRVRIPQKLDVVTFWSWNLDVVVFRPWNLDVVAFCPLKKCLGITMSWVNCLRFSMSWLFGLGISMSWYMCLRGLVFVFTKSIMLHN